MYLAVHDVARRLSITEEEIEQALARGHLHASWHSVGGTPWFSEADVLTYNHDRRAVSSRSRSALAHGTVEENVLQQTRVFHYLSDAVVVSDLEGSIIDWTPAAAALYGYRAEEVRGRSIEMLFPLDRADWTAAAIVTAVAADGLWERELRFERRDGMQGTCAASIVPLRDGQGQMIATVAVLRDVTERILLEEHLRHQALHDSLTGLPNRALFLDRLGQAEGQYARRGARWALLLVDLDGFKGINDTQGHLAGDTVLRAVAERLTSTVRKIDTVARLGGDEFAIILGDEGERGARAAAAKIAANASAPVALEGGEAALGLSIGIALCPTHGTDGETLLRLADLAMYQAKRENLPFQVYGVQSANEVTANRNVERVEEERHGWWIEAWGRGAAPLGTRVRSRRGRPRIAERG